jgi:hypothetical protein
MRVGARWYIVGSLVLLGLFGCSRSNWFGEREPWRREAEIACFKSGTVREGPGIVQLRPIEGPGMCGADFPLKVSALGSGSALGFADDPRPPAAVPQYSPMPVQRAPYAPLPPSSYPPVSGGAPPYGAPPTQAADAPAGPMPIHPPGLDPADNEDDAAGAEPPGAGAVPAPYITPRQSVEPLPPLGPERAPTMANAATAVTPPATLACPMVSAVDRWIANSVQPAAQRWFGQPVVELHQISAYSCRGMNGNPHAHISEHAFGNALDVASFTFADGRKVTVQNGWRGAPEERGFLHDIYAAACQQFTTVLGPGSNAFHYNHFHLDLMRHARGRSICNPAPIPGDAVASRPGNPLVTGSIAPQGRPTRALGFADEHRLVDDRLPVAVPGED